MSGAFSDTAFGKDTALSSTAFEFGVAAIVVIDTHDGERKRRRDEEFRNARERLRAQIREAIEGPPEPITEDEAKPLFRAIEVADTSERIEDLLQQMDALNELRSKAEIKHETERKRRELQMRWDDEDDSDFEAMML